MLLAIDIGNTNIALAILKGKSIVKVYSVSSQLKRDQLSLSLQKTFKTVFRKYPKISAVTVCSVAPKILKVVQSVVRKELNLKPIVVGKDIKVPIKNKYRRPSEVGQDRLVGAYAAKELYGSPLIIVDFGTAITFDVVSSKGDYEGGMILPGIQLSADSLFHKTALLPRIEAMAIPKNLIGKNTKESILSGIFHGYGEMCGGLIEKISKKLKQEPRIILTGGYARLIKKLISIKIDRIDQALVFKGLYLLMKKSHQ